MSRLTRDGTVEPVSRDQILRHARRQENIRFPCSADHEQDWQPYPVDPYSAICDDHTYIHTYIFITFSVLVAIPKKILYTVANPARGLLNREKTTSKKSLAAPPPPPFNSACSEKKEKRKSRDASTCLGATQQVSVRLASVQGFLRLDD